MTISQREARRLRKRVEELERERDQQRNAWATDYFGGTHIATLDVENLTAELSAINTARRLRHAVVVTTDGPRIRFHALPLPSR